MDVHNCSFKRRDIVTRLSNLLHIIAEMFQQRTYRVFDYLDGSHFEKHSNRNQHVGQTHAQR